MYAHTEIKLFWWLVLVIVVAVGFALYCYLKVIEVL
jgi:NADH:ubiquinone oxidoreductase subunit 2 (subunit N)